MKMMIQNLKNQLIKKKSLLNNCRIRRIIHLSHRLMEILCNKRMIILLQRKMQMKNKIINIQISKNGGIIIKIQNLLDLKIKVIRALTVSQGGRYILMEYLIQNMD